ncbi:MAG: O-antigen ligase family protein [Planctomycetota bacterium]
MDELVIFLSIGIPVIAVLVCAWLRFQPRPNFALIPTCCLAVLLVGSVFGHDFFHLSIGPIPLTTDRVLLGMAGAFFAWRFLISKEHLEPINRLDGAILIWLALITISTLSAKFTIMENMPISRLLFFNWMPAILYFVTRQCRMGIRELKLITVSMGLFGLYLALTAVAEMRSYDALIFPKYILTSEFQEFFGRGRGPFLNPIANGTFLTVCFCCVLAWWPRSNNRLRFGLVILAMVISMGVYATLTRSNWLSLVAACGLFVFLPSPQRVKGGMLILVTLAAIILAPMLSDKLFSFKRDRDVSQADMEQSAKLRPLFAIVAWKMFQDRPLAGVGFGQYAKAKYPYLKDPDTGKPLTLTRSFMQHNVFLAYLTESGLIGLSLLLLLLIQATRVCWTVWSQRSTDLMARQMGLIGLVLLSCYVINGMFHDVSIVPQMHMLFLFWLGLVNNIYSRPLAFVGQREEMDTVPYTSYSSTESLAA